MTGISGPESEYIATMSRVTDTLLTPNIYWEQCFCQSLLSFPSICLNFGKTRPNWHSLRRLEQVDEALHRSLISSYSKVSAEYLYRECGSLKLRHILSMNRIIYHNHLITLGNEETIRKIFEKQKLDPTQNYWFQLLKKRFFVYWKRNQWKLN